MGLPRAWMDVDRIVRARKRYIELILKKMINSSQRNGYHGGVCERESTELFGMEISLPTEVLLAFHLVALRCAITVRLEDKSK